MLYFHNTEPKWIHTGWLDTLLTPSARWNNLSCILLACWVTYLLLFYLSLCIIYTTCLQNFQNEKRLKHGYALLGKLYTSFFVVLQLSVFEFPSSLLHLTLFSFCSRLYHLSGSKWWNGCLKKIWAMALLSKRVDWFQVEDSVNIRVNI